MEQDENLNVDDELEEEVEGTETDPDNGDADDEFEYDEEGNIIIPDVVEDDDSDADEDGDESPEPEQDDSSEQQTDDADEGQKTDPEKPAEDERDKRIAELERENKALKSQGKETLKKLGVETDDVLAGFEKLAAEADDIPVEEYRKKRAESARDEEARQLLQRTEFEKKMKADLEELQRFYPETKKLTSITQVQNFAEFGKLRDMGLTPKQAYAAANADGVRDSVAAAVKQQSLNETKQHLQSAVPKKAKGDSITITKSELAQWRDLFPDKSDKEILALYKSSLRK